jgi:hypothetical protein
LTQKPKLKLKIKEIKKKQKELRKNQEKQIKKKENIFVVFDLAKGQKKKQIYTT